MKKQAGGTFLGVTIGLLVGLAAALLVAMYVTKTPIPLVDRGVQGKPDQDALEQERNKSWNPNAGWSCPPRPSWVAGWERPPPPPTRPAQVDPRASCMGGSVNNAALPPSLPIPASPGVAPAMLPAAAPASASAAATPAAPASKPAAPKPTPEATAAPAPAAKPSAPPATTKPASGDALDELIRQRMGASAPAAAKPATSPDASGADPFLYFVQAGAFSSPGEAERQRTKLMMLGLDAKVSERDQAGRTVFRVRLGPFRKKGDADSATERLNAQGVDSALVRVQR